MKSIFALAGVLWLSVLITAVPHQRFDMKKRDQTGFGCQWCVPGPWPIEPGKFNANAS